MEIDRITYGDVRRYNADEDISFFQVASAAYSCLPSFDGAREVIGKCVDVALHPRKWISLPNLYKLASANSASWVVAAYLTSGVFSVVGTCAGIIEMGVSGIIETPIYLGKNAFGGISWAANNILGTVLPGGDTAWEGLADLSYTAARGTCNWTVRLIPASIGAISRGVSGLSTPVVRLFGAAVQWTGVITAFGSLAFTVFVHSTSRKNNMSLKQFASIQRTFDFLGASLRYAKRISVALAVSFVAAGVVSAFMSLPLVSDYMSMGTFTPYGYEPNHMSACVKTLGFALFYWCTEKVLAASRGGFRVIADQTQFATFMGGLKATATLAEVNKWMTREERLLACADLSVGSSMESTVVKEADQADYEIYFAAKEGIAGYQLAHDQAQTAKLEADEAVSLNRHHRALVAAKGVKTPNDLVTIAQLDKLYRPYDVTLTFTGGGEDRVVSVPVGAHTAVTGVAAIYRHIDAVDRQDFVTATVTYGGVQKVLRLPVDEALDDVTAVAFEGVLPDHYDDGENVAIKVTYDGGASTKIVQVPVNEDLADVTGVVGAHDFTPAADERDVIDITVSFDDLTNKVVTVDTEETANPSNAVFAAKASGLFHAADQAQQTVTATHATVQAANTTINGHKGDTKFLAAYQKVKGTLEIVDRDIEGLREQQEELKPAMRRKLAILWTIACLERNRGTFKELTAGLLNEDERDFAGGKLGSWIYGLSKDEQRSLEKRLLTLKVETAPPPVATVDHRDIGLTQDIAAQFIWKWADQINSSYPDALLEGLVPPKVPSRRRR